MNIAMIVAYDGTNYKGWQVQKNKPSIQAELEQALQQVFGFKIDVFGSGRTDAGVHSMGQVANFCVPDQKLDVWKLKNHINALLPSDIRVQSCKQVQEEFHARKTAKQKTYGYYFYASKTPNPFYDKFAAQFKCELDEDLLYDAAKQIVGTHDFSAFCASRATVKSKTRTVYEVELVKQQGVYLFRITGNGFLYHMVRNLVGTVVDIASGKLQTSMQTLLKSQDRTLAGKTAPAKGLVLMQVNYEQKSTK